MTDDSVHKPDSSLELDAFNARHSPAGLFQKYCERRLRYFHMRFLGIFIAIPPAILVIGWQYTLLAIFVIIVGESIDLMLLRKLRGMDLSPKQLQFWRRVSVFTALIQVQSGTVTLFPVMMYGGWQVIPFVMSICFGLALDAAMMYGLNKPAAFVRATVYSVTPFVFFLLGDFNATTIEMPWMMHLSAFVMMIFIVWFSTKEMAVSRNIHAVAKRELLERSLELSQSNTALNSVRNQSRRLAMVAEQANDIVTISDVDGTILWVNKTFTVTTGYTFEEAVGQNLSLLNGDDSDPEAQSRLFKARRENKAVREEIVARCKDGSSIWVEVNLTPIVDPETNEVQFIGVERDITTQKQREAMLAQARIDAEEAARAKDAFLATMSHEIRTPMNGILATADVFRDTNLDDEQITLLDTITASGESLLTIINDILDFSQLQAGKVQIAKEPFSLKSCAENVVRLLNPLAQAKGLTLTLDWDVRIGDPFAGDNRRIRQILVNLVGNAIKFTRTGGVILSIRSVPSGETEDLSISVIDTGIGIAPDRQHAIFETFAQADATISRKFGGTGLGLAISKYLAEALGGTLRVASVLGDGTTFTFDITLQRAISAANTAAASTSASVASLQNLRVLVAEDNRTNRMLLQKMLAPYQMQLCFAFDGVDAVEDFRTMQPELVLMDVSMPQMDGLQATRHIRAFETASGQPPVPIIALTANAFSKDRENCLDAGMSGFLTKPFQRSQLIAEILAHTPLLLDAQTDVA